MDHRSEVQEFLRTRRARLTSDKANLIGGSHRRVPGLRREEVALLAGVSVDYYAQSSDVRSWFPRFSSDARAANQPIVDLLHAIAARRNATAAQIALAWLLAQKPWIVPIPGTRKLERLDENLGSVDIELTSEDLRELDAAGLSLAIQGGRGTGQERYT
jgi:Aldo/keto reductase family